MNPYAAPAASPSEDRIDPRFQVIQPVSRIGRVATVLPVVLYVGTFLFLLRASAHSARILAILAGGLFGVSLSPLVNWFRTSRLVAALRNHPLALDGRALYGGLASVGWGFHVRRGFLFITAEDVIFFDRSGGWRSGELTTIPLADIDFVKRDKWLGLLSVGLTFQLRSGAVVSFLLSRAKVWEKTLQEVAAADSAAPLV